MKRRSKLNSIIKNTNSRSTTTGVSNSRDPAESTSSHPEHSRPEAVIEEKVQRSYSQNLVLDAARSIEDLTMSIWDFGGQEVFYTMHHIFLTKRGIYLVVFDAREAANPDSVEELKRNLLFWLRSVKLHAPDAPVLLVGTHIGDMQESLMEVANMLQDTIKNNFPQVLREKKYVFFPVDNRHRLGIDKLRRAIEVNARLDEGIKQEVSIRWMALLDEIQAREATRPFLTLENDVRPICRNVGITSSLEQEEALEYFHQRGFIIHLTSSEVLKNYIVIQPMWLIDGLSRVIRDPLIHVNYDLFESAGLREEAINTFEGGVTSKDFLDFVWEGYPIGFFVDLMKRTMLLSEWDEGEQYLIPSLLKKKTTDNEDSHAGTNITFDFSESFLPKGIFPRLVCLCIEYSSRKVAKDYHRVLYRDYASIKLSDSIKILLIEDEENLRINCVVRDRFMSRKAIEIVQSMLHKIDYDVSGGGLKFKTFVTHEETNKQYSFADARKPNSLFPFLQDEEPQRQHKCSLEYTNFELNAFLEGL